MKPRPLLLPALFLLGLALPAQAHQSGCHAGTPARRMSTQTQVIRPAGVRELARLLARPASVMGVCPGFVVDHIVPLACGGADAPENMQWQTRADALAKDRWERDACK